VSRRALPTGGRGLRAVPAVPCRAKPCPALPRQDCVAQPCQSEPRLARFPRACQGVARRAPVRAVRLRHHLARNSPAARANDEQYRVIPGRPAQAGPPAPAARRARPRLMAPGTDASCESARVCSARRLGHRPVFPQVGGFRVCPSQTRLPFRRSGRPRSKPAGASGNPSHRPARRICRARSGPAGAS
jgi:hypothetical protein